MIGYIYKTTNLVTGLIYIGKHEASEFEPQRYIGNGKLLREQINSFGKDAFVCELLDTAETIDELFEKERYWIAKLDARNSAVGYNIALGGSGVSGYDFSAEARQKMSKACTENNLKRDKQIYQKIAETHRGNKLMNNGEIQKWIHKDEIDAYVSNGWIMGSCKKRNRVYETGEQWKLTHGNNKRDNRIWIHKGDKKRWIQKEFLQEFLADGWSLKMKD